MASKPSAQQHSPVCVFGFCPSESAQSLEEGMFSASCSSDPGSKPQIAVTRTRSLLSELIIEDEIAQETTEDEDSEEPEECASSNARRAGLTCSCGMGVNLRGDLHARHCPCALSLPHHTDSSRPNFQSGCPSPSSPVPMPTKTYWRNPAFVEERNNLVRQRITYRAQMEQRALQEQQQIYCQQ